MSKYNQIPGLDERLLGHLVFWNLALILDEEENADVDEGTGNGYHIGTLAEDVGPFNKGALVMLENNGDEINLSLPNIVGANYNWTRVYKFNVILQPPIIVTPKTKAR